MGRGAEAGLRVVFHSRRERMPSVESDTAVIFSLGKIGKRRTGQRCELIYVWLGEGRV